MSQDRNKEIATNNGTTETRGYQIGNTQQAEGTNPPSPPSQTGTGSNPEPGTNPPSGGGNVKTEKE